MVSLKEIENQLKSGIEETNDAAGKKVMKLKSVKRRTARSPRKSVSTIFYIRSGRLLWEVFRF